MADLGNIYGTSGKSNIQLAVGEINGTGFSSEFNKNSYLDDSYELSSTPIDFKSNISNVIPNVMTTYFVMRGKDVDCVGIVYRTWTVTGAPDTTGAQYIGTKCGVSSLQDIIVLFKYTQ